MKKILMLTICLLAMMAWGVAQQTGSTPDASQSTPPSASQSQTPSQSQSTPGAAGQDQTQTGAASSAPITEGCLGGSKGNFTLTDKAGKTYKLNIPPNADASLEPHVGESVMVMGNVNTSGASPSIDAEKMGKGTGTCKGSSSGTATPQPH